MLPILTELTIRLVLQEASGSRDAQTVYRDTQTGAKMSKEEFEAAAKKASDKKKDVYEAPEWGGGMRQVNFLLLTPSTLYGLDVND